MSVYDDLDTLVGSDQYRSGLETALEEPVETRGLETVLELNRARYVAGKARDEGETAYAEALEDTRESFFEPLAEFDEKMADETFGALTEREASFLHYPGPPHHFIEAAEDEGLSQLGEEYPSADLDSLEDQFDEEQMRLEAVYRGAKSLAEQQFHEVQEQFQDPAYEDEIQKTFAYDSAAEYASTIAFNAALAAEAWLEDEGDLIYGP